MYYNILLCIMPCNFNLIFFLPTNEHINFISLSQFFFLFKINFKSIYIEKRISSIMHPYILYIPVYKRYMHIKKINNNN